MINKPKPDSFSGVLGQLVFFFIKAKKSIIAVATVSFFNVDKGKKNKTKNQKAIWFGYKPTALFLVCSLLILGCTDPRTESITNLEQQYALKLASGQVAEAIEIRRSILRLDPNDPAHLDSLASLYFKMGDFKKALSMADSAMEIIPSIETVRVAVKSTRQLRHYMAGEQYSQLLLSMDTVPSAETLFDLAWFQHHARFYEDCIATFEQILAQSEFQHVVFPEEMLINGKLAEVEVPLWAICYNLIGISHFQLRNGPAAKTAFKQSLAIYPNYSTSTNYLRKLRKFGF